MFEPHPDDLWQPDPHYQAAGAAGLLFLVTGVVQGLLVLFASVLALIDSRDPSLLLYGLLLRGPPPVGHLFVGSVLLLLANVGRQGPLPGSTRFVLLAAALWALLAAGFDLCTCNVLVLPLDLFCLAASVFGGVFLSSRGPS